MFRLIISVFIFFQTLNLLAQYPSNPIKPSSGEARLLAAKQRVIEQRASIYSTIPSNAIGPTIMSGRVVDVAVDPQNSKHFFVAYATGGVWETKNNGQSFKSIFDNNGITNNCGAIAVNWTDELIYIGTGEANSSRSSYAGYGIFRSSFSDGGFDWEHLGLVETHHIARILIHPKDPNTLFVAALGNLFSPSSERGVYKSTDAGRTWEQVLFVSENTGIIDIEFNLQNLDQLVAASWQKSRRAWNFWEAGSESGIYITTNGGASWEKNASFPSSAKLGRIGLATSQDGAIYALVDNQQEYEKTKATGYGLEKEDFTTMNVDSFLALQDSSLSDFLKKNRFPKKYTAKEVKKLVRKGAITPKLLHDYLTDSNSALFNKNVKGAELYVSRDLGDTWVKTHQEVLDKVCYTYGYYFGTVQVNPTNSSQVYIAGVPLLKSSNGGQIFSFIGGNNVHVDHHYIWINPLDSNHIINGNDGGINISYDGGQHWIKCNSPAVGQFYTVAVDQKKNYNVYGGLQDNGVWKGPHTNSHTVSWHQEGRYPYQRLLGGDGMRIAIDQKGSVYTGYQFGHYYRIDRDGKRKYIHPMQQDIKDPPLRWNWQTPILLSSHNDQILYMGSNMLHRSMDQGETFSVISKDLTNGPVTGDVSYGTITDISESPLKFGLIYTGSDDGNVYCSKDGGDSWLNCTKGLPKNYWVKRVVASRHQKSRVYVVLNGHNWDNNEALLFYSENYGQDWERVGANLPQESLNVVREDLKDDKRLYVGSDAGLYVSFDKGKTFHTLSNLPVVPVHDLAINQNKNHLVVATHGRSLFRIDLKKLDVLRTYADSSLTLLPPDKVKFNKNWGERGYNWDVLQPTLEIEYISNRTDDINLIIENEEQILFSKTIKTEKGLNSLKIPIVFMNPEHSYPTAGKYKIKIVQGETTAATDWVIEAD